MWRLDEENFIVSPFNPQRGVYFYLKAFLRMPNKRTTRKKQNGLYTI